MATDADDVAEAFHHLKRAEWSIGDAALATEGGEVVWLVTGRNGENLMHAEGTSQVSGWREADGQAPTGEGLRAPFRFSPGEGRVGSDDIKSLHVA